MKYYAFALLMLLALAGCSKYEVYERNMNYVTADTLQSEKAIVLQRVQKAQVELSRAQATNNFEIIRPAERELNDALQQLRVIEQEERRRARGW